MYQLIKLPFTLNKLAKLIKPVTSRLAVARETAADCLAAIKVMLAEAGLLHRICFFLESQPSSWLYIPPGNTKFDEMCADIREIYYDLPENPIILVHSGHRWVLVKVADRLLPFVFIDRAGCTRLYRIIAGTGASFLPDMHDAVCLIIASGGYYKPDDTDKLASSIKVPSMPLRAKKWDAGGFKI